MISKYVPSSVSRAVGRTMLKVDANSPRILFGVGVVGMLGTVVLASRATLKVEDVLKEHEKKMLDVKTVQHVNYTEQDRQHDKLYLYIQTTTKLVRLYAPAVILGSVSVGALTKSHNILQSRNAALSAAYAGLEATFGRYRDRVKEAVGEEKEKELWLDVQEYQTLDAKGKPITAVGAGPFGGSPYAKFYDANNRNFVEHVPEMNITVLRQRQNYLNDMLRLRGHLFLNEAYRELGFDDTEAGAVVGWFWDPENKIKWEDGKTRDSFVDFGIWADSQRDQLLEMVCNGDGIFLDFNVNGEIHKKLQFSKPVWHYTDKHLRKKGHR